MPRILTIDPRVPTLSGVLIPRHAVQEQVRAHNTIEQARSYARRIVKEAQNKAASLEQQALREGFQAGWLDSLNAVFNALADGNQLHRNIEDELKQSVRKSLESSLQQPGLELHLLEGWLASGPDIAEDINVILPRGAQDQIHVLKHRIEQATGIAPGISTGESNNVVIQSGNQVYEFSPERTMEVMNDLVRRCFQRMEVRKKCAAWSAEIVQSWLNEIEQRHESIAVEESDPEWPIDEDDFDSESALNFFRK